MGMPQHPNPPSLMGRMSGTKKLLSRRQALRLGGPRRGRPALPRAGLGNAALRGLLVPEALPVGELIHFQGLAILPHGAKPVRDQACRHVKRTMRERRGHGLPRACPAATLLPSLPPAGDRGE